MMTPTQTNEGAPTSGRVAATTAPAVSDKAPALDSFCPSCGCDEVSYHECPSCGGTGAYRHYPTDGTWYENMGCDECVGMGTYFECEGCGARCSCEEVEGAK